ncbi:hypothetical protein N9M41_07380 [Rhodopirellula sp.]|nr:hypothetical protein [Rhodopirellula sp.]
MDDELSRKKWRWPLRFSLRSLFILVSVVALALRIYEPLTLHLKALDFINRQNSFTATRPHPGELLYSVQGRGNQLGRQRNAVLCQVGQVRIVLLDRTHDGGTCGFLPVLGDEEQRGGNASASGDLYFSYVYAEGKAECEVHGFPFECDEETIKIGGQSFRVDSQTVVLIDQNDQVLYEYSRQRR